MTDERDTTKNQERDGTDDLDNQLDSLLPVPDEHTETQPEHGQVDGPMDEVLPVPGEPSESEDDASTQEEMEVDTTADDVDDIIPLHRSDDEAKTNAAQSDVDQADIKSFAVNAETESGSQHDATSVTDIPTTSTCLVCGAEITGARFCPECGTEQIPTSRFLAKFSPLFMWSRPLAIRVTLSIAAFLVLLALLGDSGANALIITASTLPVILLIRIASQLGGWSRNGWIQIGMMALVGLATSLPIAWLATRLVIRSWFEGGIFYFGATGFGGIAVDSAGSPPFLVWLTVGILLPLVIILVITGAPAGLRMALGQAPVEGTGMMLSAATAAGYVVGSAIIFYWPLYSEMAPVMTTSEWTLTIFGVAVIRPLVWIFSGAMLGAVVWRYFRTASLPGVAVPAAIAIGIPLMFSILSLVVAPTGLWSTVILGLVFAGGAAYLHERFLHRALQNDAT